MTRDFLEANCKQRALRTQTFNVFLFNGHKKITIGKPFPGS